MTIAADGPSTPSVEGVLTRRDDALQPLSRKRSQSRGHAAEGRGDSVLDLLRVRHFTREPATHGCCSPGPATDVGVHVGLPQQFQIANEAMLSNAQHNPRRANAQRDISAGAVRLPSGSCCCWASLDLAFVEARKQEFTLIERPAFKAKMLEPTSLLVKEEHLH